MQQRALGRSDLQLSEIGLGCNNFGTRLDARASAAVVEAAIEAGITHFDTAESYGDGLSEEHLGQVVRRNRDEVVIASKFGGRDRTSTRTGAPASAANVVRSCEGSLRRLGTDYIDLYYLHFPDPDTPIVETLTALGELIDAGKVRHLAVSNLTDSQLQGLAVAGQPGEVGFAGCQLEWNLLRRDCEADLVPTCRRLGLGIVPYYPLASGLLTGKYRHEERPPENSRFAAWPDFAKRTRDSDFEAVDRLTSIADGLGISTTELAIAWLLAQDDVASVITGATSPAQVRANAGSAGRSLSEADLAAIDTAVRAKS